VIEVVAIDAATVNQGAKLEKSNQSGRDQWHLVE
jgi:hypothetical protein